MDARPPSNSGKKSTPRKSGKKKQKPVEEEEKGEEDEPEEAMANQSPCFSGVAFASCVFAMLMIVGGVANLIIFIAFISADKFKCYTLEAIIITHSTTAYPYVGFECSVGILAVLILIPGILIKRIKDPVKTVPVAVLSFISIFIALFIWLSEGATAFSMFVYTISGYGIPCVLTLIISSFLSLFGFVAFILTIVSFTLLMSKRNQALMTKANKPLERVKKSKRNVVSASKKKEMKQNVEGEDDDDSEEDEEENSVGKNSSRGSGYDLESAEESETDKPPANETEKPDFYCLPPIYSRDGVEEPRICCVRHGTQYYCYAANPFNQATMDNGCVWGRPQTSQYNIFSPTHF